jgi:hypothetical protein
MVALSNRILVDAQMRAAFKPDNTRINIGA